MATSINNLQLQQVQLIEQHFSGYDALQDRPITETKIALPYLIELYLRYNKGSISYTQLADLARLSRYILTESKSNKIIYPQYTVRWKLTYDYSLVPAFNATIESRTGKMIYDEALGTLTYRFVVALLPNSTTFDVYLDSNFAVTDIPVTFEMDVQNFTSWLPTSRFNDQKLLLDNYFETNLRLLDILDYESFQQDQFDFPNDYVIKYLSDSLELLESMI